MMMLVLALCTLVMIGVHGACGGGSSNDDQPDLGCVFPDGQPDQSCHCFDGDFRCNRTCPIDLSLPCTPGEGCGDLSGGSAGTDCNCTCGADSTWTCTGPNGTCIPM